MLNHTLGKIFGRAVGCPCVESLFDFALDGLDPRSQDKVRRHLIDCPRCAEQVKDYAWVSEGIALTAPQVEPPSGLCDKVKSRIRDEAGNNSLVIQYRERALAGWPQFWLRLGPVFAATSVLMSLAALFAFYAASKSSPMVFSTQTAQAKEVFLLGQGSAAHSSAQLLFESGRDTVLVQIRSLKACPAGKVYTLWKNDGSGLVRLADFSTADGKGGSYFLHLSQPLTSEKKSQIFEITLENPGQPASEQQGPLSLRGQINL